MRGPLWSEDASGLVSVQERLADAAPPPWALPETPIAIGGCFVAFVRGQAGPGRAGDRAWAGACVLVGSETAARTALFGAAGARYEPGLLWLREGPLLADAAPALAVRPELLLVDATGRDHPRGAGLALHLGAVLDIPTVGVTHRPLSATGLEPGPGRGEWSALHWRGEEVARWVRTRTGVRPVVAHAAWRTDAAAAAEVVLRTATAARTPEPLRRAREVARSARASDQDGQRGR